MGCSPPLKDQSGLAAWRECSASASACPLGRGDRVARAARSEHWCRRRRCECGSGERWSAAAGVPPPLVVHRARLRCPTLVIRGPEPRGNPTDLRGARLHRRARGGERLLVHALPAAPREPRGSRFGSSLGSSLGTRHLAAAALATKGRAAPTCARLLRECGGSREAGDCERRDVTLVHALARRVDARGGRTACLPRT